MVPSSFYTSYPLNVEEVYLGDVEMASLDDAQGSHVQKVDCPTAMEAPNAQDLRILFEPHYIFTRYVNDRHRLNKLLALPADVVEHVHRQLVDNQLLLDPRARPGVTRCLSTPDRLLAQLVDDAFSYTNQALDTERSWRSRTQIDRLDVYVNELLLAEHGVRGYDWIMHRVEQTPPPPSGCRSPSSTPSLVDGSLKDSSPELLTPDAPSLSSLHDDDMAGPPVPSTSGLPYKITDDDAARINEIWATATKDNFPCVWSAYYGGACTTTLKTKQLARRHILTHIPDTEGYAMQTLHCAGSETCGNGKACTATSTRLSSLARHIGLKEGGMQEGIQKQVRRNGKVIGNEFFEVVRPWYWPSELFSHSTGEGNAETLPAAFPSIKRPAGETRSTLHFIREEIIEKFPTLDLRTSKPTERK